MRRSRTNLVLGLGAATAAAVLAFGHGRPATHVASVGASDLPQTVTQAQAMPILPPPRISTTTTTTTTTTSTTTATVDLGRMKRVGDRYEAPMSDGSVAILTIDPRLQELAEHVLQRAKAPRGAIVMTDKAGRILALAGRRTADPKGGKTGVSDVSLALDAWAPAASVFKVVSATALVEAGASKDEKVCFHGGLRSVDASNLVDSSQDGRCEDLAFGLAHSQNAIIAKMVQKHLEPAALADAAHRFGFDEPLTFASSATFGQCAVPPAKGVDFARTAAGFTNVHLSPLGGAILAGTIANRGEAPGLTVIAAIERGGHETPVAPVPGHHVTDRRVAAEVAAMMAETCSKGSAAKAFNGRERIADVKVAGKTGTLDTSDPFYLEYSWFVGFAPADQPELTVSVLLGNAERWYMKAHTAARAMLAEGLRRDLHAAAARK